MSDPVTVAREVLELAHEDETVTVCSVPDNKVAALAHAVARVEALVDILERESDGRGKFDSVLAYHASEVKARTADRIRAALKGGDA